jgi:hypothetical protein
MTRIQVERPKGQRSRPSAGPNCSPVTTSGCPSTSTCSARPNSELANWVRSRRGAIKDCDPRPCDAQGGAVGARLDPVNGEVLAMASYPTFDPSELVNGISTDLWERLNSKETGKPMLNRAMNETYAPGSTFKLVTTLAGLRTGVIQPLEVYQDRGVYKLEGCNGGKCEFQNAGREAPRRCESAGGDHEVVGRLLLPHRRPTLASTTAQFGRNAHPGHGQRVRLRAADRASNLPSESAGVIATPKFLAAGVRQEPQGSGTTASGRPATT